MKERPILFSAPMVQALLDGRKTQTRRVVKLKNEYGLPLHYSRIVDHRCPYGEPGDRLWVRETWKCEELENGLDGIRFAADGAFQAIENTRRASELWLNAHREGGKWRPSIFMPRWASRITLEIVNVRVERLQDISEDDAVAEGLYAWHEKETGHVHYGIDRSDVWEQDPRLTYRRLWEKINGAESWNENWWVWVIKFRKVV